MSASHTSQNPGSLSGIGVSPGVAIGPIRKVINVVSTDAIPASPRQIFEALNKVGEDLERAAATVELDVAKEVLGAQSMIAQDPALVEAIGARLDQDIIYPDTRADIVEGFTKSFGGLFNLLLDFVLHFSYSILYQHISAVTLLGVLVVDHGIIEGIYVAGCFPCGGVHKDRRVEAHNVIMQ